MPVRLLHHGRSCRLDQAARCHPGPWQQRPRPCSDPATDAHEEAAVAGLGGACRRQATGAGRRQRRPQAAAAVGQAHVASSVMIVPITRACVPPEHAITRGRPEGDGAKLNSQVASAGLLQAARSSERLVEFARRRRDHPNAAISPFCSQARVATSPLLNSAAASGSHCCRPIALSPRTGCRAGACGGAERSAPLLLL